MNSEEKAHIEEQIIKYFNGELSTEEMSELERLRAEDLGVEQLFDFNRALYNGIQSAGRSMLKEQLSQIDEELPPIPSGSNNIMFWLRLGVAATITLLATVWFLQPRTHPTNSDLFDKYYKDFEILSTGTTRGTDSLPSAMNKAILAYASQDYPLAISLFSETIEFSSQNENIYLALSYLVTDEPERAIQILEGYINNGGNLRNDAQWYLALSLLKNDQIIRAKAVLKEVLDNPKAGIQADLLLEKLE